MSTSENQPNSNADSSQDASISIPPEIQANILQALASSSSKNRPKGSLLSTFTGKAEVLAENDANKYNLLCPRPECGSVIMLKGVAKCKELAAADPIDSENHALSPHLPALDHTAETSWWYVSGSPMVFENVAFSRAIPSTSGGVTKKLLACGECELGPLGWSAGNEYWLAIDRVSYKT
ncbi:Mss4-like protein [Serendipita vermifera]|nr:Mss4-like protein [Serendipita vermifera]